MDDLIQALKKALPGLTYQEARMAPNGRDAIICGFEVDASTVPSEAALKWFISYITRARATKAWVRESLMEKSRKGAFSFRSLQTSYRCGQLGVTIITEEGVYETQVCYRGKLFSNQPTISELES
jgi:hypothetical protein